MLFLRVKTPGLAHNAYVLECGTGEAVVVDPRRDVAEYVEAARKAGLVIRYVLETHRQEDFESGADALRRLAGAKIVTGAHELFGRSDVRLRDGEELTVGKTRFRALGTPGHTPESVCYAVYRPDAGERCWAVFTGDALFVGETGRTDLTDPARTAENAGLLYDAIHAKLSPLGDQALIYPAHGAGSACGGNIGERDESTLGIERQTNPAFSKTREQFIEHKLAEKLPRPPYFTHMEEVNLQGGRPLPPVESVKTLSPAAFQAAMREAIVFDTRPPEAFAAAHIPGSHNIWLNGLSSFAGWFADDRKAKLLLVTASPDDFEPAALSLARVGIQAIEGVLAGGVAAWRESGLPITAFGTTSAREAAAWKDRREATILDVRDGHEWREGHIPGAVHVYVGHLERSLSAVPREPGRRLVVHCSVGNRSGIAASVLHRHGFENLYNLLGGMKAWQAAELPVEKPARGPRGVS